MYCNYPGCDRYPPPPKPYVPSEDDLEALRAVSELLLKVLEMMDESNT